MPIDDDILYRAQGKDRAAMSAILEAVYPPVQRIALGLAGREDVARGVVRFVVRQGLARLDQFRDGDAAERWFLHHTVLTARRAAKHKAGPRDDALILKCDKADAAYVAFIRALRSLTMQQQEAFLLYRGEKMDLRRMAQTMDCSTQAAEMHLNTAHQALEPLSAGAFDEMRLRLAEAYARLTPNRELLRPVIQKHVERALWPKKVKRTFVWIIILGLIATATWAYFKYGAKWFPSTQGSR